MSEEVALAAELRRLRAALGASAEELAAARSADPAELLAEELAFLQQLAAARAAGQPPARDELIGLWRALRLRATALAADLPPTAEAVRLLRERLARDGAHLPAPRSRPPPTSS